MKYFEIWEFDCSCNGCQAKGDWMKSDTLRMLDTARGYAGVPFKITSGMRCEDHNAEVGGSPTSSHLAGYAADIATTGSPQRFAILDGLRKARFTRFGISRDFIHADNDPAKSPEVCWLYS